MKNDQAKKLLFGLAVLSMADSMFKKDKKTKRKKNGNSGKC